MQEYDPVLEATPSGVKRPDALQEFLAHQYRESQSQNGQRFVSLREENLRRARQSGQYGSKHHGSPPVADLSRR